MPENQSQPRELAIIDGEVYVRIHGAGCQPLLSPEEVFYLGRDENDPSLIAIHECAASCSPLARVGLDASQHPTHPAT